MKQERVHELFSRTAAVMQDNLAIDFGDKRITYAELEEKSNILANFLIESGASRGSIAAILAENGIEVITALIAVLKAGCIFVPLDPRLPEKKVAAMLVDVPVKWFIVESKFINHIPVGREANIICVDSGDIPLIDRMDLKFLKGYADYCKAESPALPSHPDDMCYIYFTSGSTGFPKGIAGRLKAIDHFIKWEIETIEIKEGTRFSHLISPSYDAYLRDIFVPLCAGGVICGSKDIHASTGAGELIDWIDRAGINLIHCFPSVFRTLLSSYLKPTQFPALKNILLSGEQVRPSDVGKWTEIFGDRVRLVNLYGPSETTMTKLFYFIKPSDKDRLSIPIGKPMPGAKAIILDSAGKPCPPGVIGEIYIRTPYRSLGYYNRPELTNEVFIQNPFTENPDDLIYKTGDLGRLLEDGNLEFLGRKDHQVKIRGVRVGLREIENFLLELEVIEDVAVIDRDDGAGNKYLCAYIVCQAEPDLSALKAHLAERLPDYMIPSVVIPVASLPRTINGKLDRRALPSVEDAQASGGRVYLGPRTPTEEILTTIWSQALNLHRVDVGDNFFEIGGHSLSATQVILKVKTAFDVELPLRAILDAPTVFLMARRIEELKRGAQGHRLPSINRAPRDGPLALSFAQNRLWIIHQFDPGSPSNILADATRVEGALDLGAVQKTINEIIRRHESLRTTFPAVDGVPTQVIAPAEEISLPFVDLSQLPESVRDLEVIRLGNGEAHRPFDLEKGPLFRFFLIRMTDQNHVIVRAMHHIITDGWSQEVLGREIGILYNAYSEGKPSPLPELPIQYADYAIWQKEWMQGEVLESQLSYWKKQLAGAPQALDLPTDRPRPAVQTFESGRQSLAIAKQFTDSIRSLSRREGVTMFMAMLAAFKVLLSRYTGQEDIVVGFVTANRNRAEIENLIGFFVNTLLMRTALTGDPTFHEVLVQVREVTLGALANQDLPFEKLIEEMQPERGNSRAPMAQVVIAYQNIPRTSLELPGLTLSKLNLEAGSPEFDLSLFMEDSGPGMFWLMHYNKRLFDDISIGRLLEHLKILLEGTVADPNQRISKLPMLSNAEREMLATWNNTRVDYLNDSCIHRIFERQAELTPDAVSVVFEESQLSYRELNRNANQLAHYLNAHGVGPEALVAVFIDRSLEMVVGLLGVLKAGGAYVPIDLSQPRERVTRILADTQAPVILSQKRFAETLPERYQARAVYLDADRTVISQQCMENPPGGVVAENSAYVIYTSGSTGGPKGVLIQHRSVLNLLKGLDGSVYKNSEQAGLRISLNGPISFDTSVKQLIQLLHGHTLYILPQEIRSDENAMLSYLQRHGVNVLDCTPSQLRVLLAAGMLTRPAPALTKVLVGGEAVDESIWRILTQNENVKFYNVYGPTECTVNSAVSPVQTTPVRPNIGRPIANVQIHLLDRHQRQVSPGAPGEISIAGESLARGYLNNPELTAEKFFPNQFADRPGSRLYKTGDLARHLRSGDLGFLGRVDRQVKVRGYRIELGEIEALLTKHPAVKDAVVTVHSDSTGGNALFAYIIPHLKHSPTIGGKSRYVLPNQMAIAHLNKNETDFLYKEVFETNSYLRHGITISDNDCIFDVGANIGLFTLLASQKGHNLRIYAFEPNPYVAEILRLNLMLFDVQAKLFECGLGSECKNTTFTFYPKFSFLSGIYADADEDKEVVRSFIRKQRTGGRASAIYRGQNIDSLLEELLQDRFNSKSFDVPLMTLSEVIKENNIDRIDLIKINVEKSELDVIAGISDRDWERINQVVLELHDIEGRLNQVTSLLDRQGYQIEVEQDWSLEESQKSNYYVYAVRELRRDSSSRRSSPHANGQEPPRLENPILSASELRSYLREQIPDYMMPSNFIMLETIPRTSNGKIDRKMLPSPLEHSSLEAGAVVASPRTPIEELLTGIWSRVLKIERIGVYDNFFDLGGHSLLATQVISRVREALNLEVPLPVLFEAPTVAGFAEKVEKLMSETSGLKAPPITRAPRKGNLPLSFAQQRLWIVHQLDPDSPAYNISNADRISGPLILNALFRAFYEIVRRHEALRTTFSSVEGVPMQVIDPSPHLALSMVDLADLPSDYREREARRLADEDAQRPFDLAKGPLLRVTLLRLSDEDHVALHTMHHIISDGWSMEVLDREIVTLYNAYSSGRTSPLPELAIQYADFAHWQRQWLQGEVLEAQLSYWKRQLAGSPPLLELATDRPRPEMQSFRGARRSVVLSKPLSEEIKALSRRKDATLFMTLLAAFKVLIYKYAGQHDIIVGTNVANRNRSETEALIGFFVNLLPLRTDLTGDPSFEELLHRVRKVALGAYAHQDVPFEKISNALKLGRSTSYTPLVQVMFVLTNRSTSNVELSGLSLSALSTNLPTSRFDLVLAVVERDAGLDVTLNYNPDLFDDHTINRMLAHYEKLLSHIAARPNEKISFWNILSGDEETQSLGEEGERQILKVNRMKNVKRKEIYLTEKYS